MIFTTSITPDTQEHKCVVHLRTETWSDNDGLYVKKRLRYLRRKCKGFNILEEDVSNLGVNETTEHLINLFDVPDGVYEVVTCNKERDRETGYIDEYDYKLIPITE